MPGRSGREHVSAVGEASPLVSNSHFVWLVSASLCCESPVCLAYLISAALKWDAKRQDSRAYLPYSSFCIHRSLYSTKELQPLDCTKAKLQVCLSCTI